MASNCIIEVLGLANQYNLPRLITLCEFFLKDVIDDENIFDILQSADLYQASQLKDLCILTVVEKQLTKKEMLEQLSPELQNEVYIKMKF